MDDSVAREKVIPIKSKGSKDSSYDLIAILPPMIKLLRALSHNVYQHHLEEHSLGRTEQELPLLRDLETLGKLRVI